MKDQIIKLIKEQRKTHRYYLRKALKMPKCKLSELEIEIIKARISECGQIIQMINDKINKE